MGEWLPIEIAPTDGTVVLGYFGADRYGVMEWTGWGGGCWRCAFTGHNIVASEPSHWMPLPDPPSDTFDPNTTGEQ